MGYIHIYCGNGKGKTTAAIGLAVRAAGRNKKVFISRFLKTDDSGEVKILNQLDGVAVMPCKKTFGFTWQMSQEQKEEACQYYTNQLIRSFEAASQADMLILDEVVGVCSLGFVDELLLIELLDQKPIGLEVVLTGRNPSENLQSKADYLSEIQLVKHPFQKGVSARAGIEY